MKGGDSMYKSDKLISAVLSDIARKRLTTDEICEKYSVTKTVVYGWTSALRKHSGITLQQRGTHNWRKIAGEVTDVMAEEEKNKSVL